MSETITIYLAIGAPFAVNYFWREQRVKGRRRFRSLFTAAGAGLLWPFVAVTVFLAHRRGAVGRLSAAAINNSLDERARGKVMTAQQLLFTALEGVRELAQTLAGQSEVVEQNIRAARAGVEKYVGLTLALAESNVDDPPASREMELCRVAGREGDDLLLVGRCIHRRNVARLVAHQARSRAELLQVLAAVREVGGERPVNPSLDVTVARRLSVAILKFYGQAIELLSLLEDEAAATKAARLLDAECTRLRQLEALRPEAAERAGADRIPVRHTPAEWNAPVQR